MIIKTTACKCAVCKHVWIPQPTKDNPSADPYLVPRCSNCKSRRWNADDPKVQKEKAQARPVTEAQRQKALRNKDLHKSREKAIHASKVESAKQAASPVLCRHRVLASSCPVCRGRV